MNIIIVILLTFISRHIKDEESTRKIILLDYFRSLSSLLSPNILICGVVARNWTACKKLWTMVRLCWVMTVMAMLLLVRISWSMESLARSGSVRAWPGSAWWSRCPRTPSQSAGTGSVAHCVGSVLPKKKDVREILFMINRSLKYTYQASWACGWSTCSSGGVLHKQTELEFHQERINQL